MSKYMKSKYKHSLLNHVAALRDLRREISEHEEQLIRVAYKPNVTNRDLGKVYKALNFLRGVSNEGERAFATLTLKDLGLKVEDN